jgi:hypothetical protein
MIVMWGLTEAEHDLAERVYYETKGSIYVDANGDLHERYEPNSERIDSQQCYAFDIFIGELENAKLRAENDAMNL